MCCKEQWKGGNSRCRITYGQYRRPRNRFAAFRLIQAFRGAPVVDTKGWSGGRTGRVDADGSPPDGHRLPSGFDIGIVGSAGRVRFAQIENLGMKGMREDEVRGAGQRGQQGGEQMGLVLDAETDRTVCGEIRTNKSVPDSDRQGPDLPDGRPVRCKEAVPVFKEVEDPLV